MISQNRLHTSTQTFKTNRSRQKHSNVITDGNEQGLGSLGKEPTVSTESAYKWIIRELLQKDIGRMGCYMSKAEVQMEEDTTLESLEMIILMEKELFVGRTEETMLDISKKAGDMDKALNTPMMEKLTDKGAGKMTKKCGFIKSQSDKDWRNHISDLFELQSRFAFQSKLQKKLQ